MDFPKRIPEKLKAIREHLKLTPDEIAPMVGARTGAKILAYENNEDDLLVTCCGSIPNLRDVRSIKFSMTISKSLFDRCRQSKT
ncbi:MAG TPA: hypothetical protein VJR02_11055 [Pyrinomonadaceae bacterium]|nr:hypothetical protein [Pyrinomonadaceae bacterium]